MRRLASEFFFASFCSMMGAPPSPRFLRLRWEKGLLASFCHALAFVFVLLLFAPPALALDRTAFSFTRYDLQLTVDPHQRALTVEGTVELRNVSNQPQSEAALQISSSVSYTHLTLPTICSV